MTSVANRIATLTMGSPPVNALTEAWLSGLSREIARLEARGDWKVLHLRSDQKVFCAGADLKEMRLRFEAADGPDRAFAYVALSCGGIPHPQGPWRVLQRHGRVAPTRR